MIKNIVFDIGGVILHLNRDGAISRFLQLGINNIEELLDPYLQKGCFLAIENGSMNKEEFRKELSNIAGRELSNEDILWAYMGFMAEVPQYKLDYIENLRKEGYPIYILSNTNPYVMEYSESEKFSEKGLPLSYYYDKKFASFEMGTVKPNEDIFLKMIEETGIKPEETLFIEDGPRNIEIAKKLGFQTYQPNNFEDWRWHITEILRKDKESNQ